MLRSFLLKFFKKDIVKVASVNAISYGVRLISGFVTSKFMAVFIGPSGMAITGNLTNFSQSLESLSTLGFKNGLVKHVSENNEDESKLKPIASTGFLMALVIGAVLCLCLFIGALPLSRFVFKKDSYAFLFQISALTMPLFSIQVFFVAVLNGLKKIKSLVVINIAGYIGCMVLTVWFMYSKQLEGALLALVLTPIILLLSLLSEWKFVLKILNSISIKCVSKRFFVEILSFFSMTLFSGIMVPVVFLVIRNHLIETLGANKAGYWEGMRKISSYFMMFIFMLFQWYLFPLLSEKKSRLKPIILEFYKTILPFVAVGFTLIYLFRHWVIQLVLTNAFLPMESLFLWQLVGDFFRIAFLAISYQFLARKMVWPYIICEAIYMALIYFISIYFIDLFGIKGVVQAHALSCFIYLVVLLFVFKKELFSSHNMISDKDYET